MSRNNDGYAFRPSRFAWRNGDPACPPVRIGDSSVKPRARPIEVKLVDQTGVAEIVTVREPRYTGEHPDVNRAAIVSNTEPMRSVDFDRGHKMDDRRCWKTRTRGSTRAGRQYERHGRPPQGAIRV